MKVILLLEGLHKIVKDTSKMEKKYIGHVEPITSSVTLIKAEKKGENNIIVDTGYYGYEKQIIEALQKEGLKPSDIKYVINTHEHFDHCANNYLFTDAIKIIDTLQWNPKNSISVFSSVESIDIQPGVTIISTPGHKTPHCSVLVKTDEGVVAIAGDTISRSFELHSHESVEKLVSATRLLSVADKIIPGHGPIIQKKDYDKIKEKIREESLRRN